MDEKTKKRELARERHNAKRRKNRPPGRPPSPDPTVPLHARLPRSLAGQFKEQARAKNQSLCSYLGELLLNSLNHQAA